YPNIVQIHPNTVRQRLGDTFVKPEYVDTIMYEARDGRVPVRGAGFRGLFGGEGWDGMWTDMSEIVRPTRDGIHGRETISTCVDIGEKPPFLRFAKDGRPEGERPRVFALQVPFVFDVPPSAGATRELCTVLASTAKRVDSLAFLPLEAALRWSLLGPEVVPVLTAADLGRLVTMGDFPAR